MHKGVDFSILTSELYAEKKMRVNYYQETFPYKYELFFLTVSACFPRQNLHKIRTAPETARMVKGIRIDSAAGQLYTLTEYFRGFVKKRAAA